MILLNALFILSSVESSGVYLVLFNFMYCLLLFIVIDPLKHEVNICWSTNPSKELSEGHKAIIVKPRFQSAEAFTCVDHKR